MDQAFEYVHAVDDPGSFIRANLDARPSNLRRLLRDMQNRKRINGTKLDRNLLNEESPSAFERAINRRREGEEV